MVHCLCKYVSFSYILECVQWTFIRISRFFFFFFEVLKNNLDSVFIGNTKNDRGEQIDTKSDQWFGATVSSAGIDGPLVVSTLGS
jgi:hypothetical protein